MLRPVLVCLALVIGATAVLADTQQDCERSAILDVELDAKIRACTAIIARDGKAAWAYTNRGLAYASKRHHGPRDRPPDFLGRAIADHTKAIEIDPNGAVYYYNRGAAYKMRAMMNDDDGDFDREIADYTRAIEIQPKAEFYDRRAYAYGFQATLHSAKRNRNSEIAYHEREIADFTKAIEIEPKAHRYSFRANTYAKLGRTAEAIADLWEAVALDAFHVYSWDQLKRLVPQAAKRDAAKVVPPVKSPPKVVVEPAISTLSPARAAAPLIPAEEHTLVPKDSFKECDTCPEMVVVPAGEFIMGSPVSEEGRLVNEGPQRKVTIARPFAVGKFEVTFAEWDACGAAGGCKHRPGDEGWGRGRRPVIFVTYKEIAKEYLPWLSQKTGKTYRLPSEAEWEYAARAGTTTRYTFGDAISPKQARFSEGRQGSAGKTVEVGSFRPTASASSTCTATCRSWSRIPGTPTIARRSTAACGQGPISAFCAAAPGPICPMGCARPFAPTKPMCPRGIGTRLVSVLPGRCLPEPAYGSDQPQLRQLWVMSRSADGLVGTGNVTV